MSDQMYMVRTKPNIKIPYFITFSVCEKNIFCGGDVSVSFEEWEDSEIFSDEGSNNVVCETKEVFNTVFH